MVAPQPESDMVTNILASVAKYGLPPALLVWVIYLGSTQLVGDVRTQTALLQTHIEANTRVLQSVDRMERRQDRIEAILRQMCVNAAKGYDQQQACWSAGER